MINFFVDESGSFGIRDYLANRGTELAGRIGVVRYEELTTVTSLPATGTIFAGLDQTGPDTRRAGAAIYDGLAAIQPRVTILNHPERALQRYALLRRLFESGRNRFSAIRATDDPGKLRYPVFIRYEHRHNGSLTPLLHDRRAVDMALGNLAFRGIVASALLIVEFCDTSDADGLYRKFSAMRIGDAIIPRHLHASRSWIAKSSSSKEAQDEQLVREELDYLSDHPHENWLRDVFTEAHIEYGRVDYGIYRGEPQVWEINTNPTLGRGPRTHDAQAGRIAEIREPGRLETHRQMLNALKRLERPDPVPYTTICLPGELHQGVVAEARARKRTFATHALRRAIQTSAVTQAVKGMVQPVLARIAPTVARLVRHRRAL